MIAEPPANPNASNWFNEFHSFTSFHLLMIAICFGLFAVLVIGGRVMLKHDQVNGTHREQTFRRVLAWIIIISQAFFFIRRFMPGHWDLQDSLPLHMCRWSVWVAAWAMYSLNPKMRALLLFWGLGLSTQGLFTPMITVGLGAWGFWIYWINHIQIIGASIYDFAVLGYRPTRRDLGFAMFWGLLYALLTIGLNWVLSTNYSYLGQGAYETSSVVDQLGPYPQRLLWMILGSELIFVLIYLFSIGMLGIRTKVFKRPAPRMIRAR